MELDVFVCAYHAVSCEIILACLFNQCPCETPSGFGTTYLDML